MLAPGEVVDEAGGETGEGGEAVGREKDLGEILYVMIEFCVEVSRMFIM